ncbi:hypothetical protein CT0861_03027 [Colletotrichum tofieldiae]|uniref:Uncharacterized protein n=1 Tax=Colletotrichum tofieldiae TaxID=708197 RepID=A0A166RJ31_9PEZI|nr:hypothetical protein CT0861_03027 [Colletotrichum tofieldiae]GKT92699.1 hypothetical protein Ct61P_10549 [Colletotrichum tofieldiae]
MGPEAHIHVVSKQDNTRHAVCKIPDSQPRSQLKPSSVRVRVELVSLSSNNLSYARGGALLHWWDAYPVPEDAPSPFNDTAEWGIVPAWGFARVTGTTIPSIAEGSRLWGMWPTSSHHVDLELAPVDSATSGLWTETSPHRSRLMTMYNHYQYTLARPDTTFAAFRCLFPVFESAHLLNQAVFPAATSSATASPIHPLGLPHLPWTDEDADLTGALVVSLSAASKTGRSLSWQLVRNRHRAGGGGDPAALLQLTSSPQTLASFADDRTPSLAIKSAAYTESMDDAVSWIRVAAQNRVVVLDFGAPATVLDAFMGALSSSAIAPASAITVIQVGQEPKVFTDAEMAAFQAQSKRLGKVQFNTSGVRDRVLKAVGAAEYLRALNESWERFYRENGPGDINLRRLTGVEGAGGIEGAWQDLCDGKVMPGIGIVIDLDSNSYAG